LTWTVAINASGRALLHADEQDRGNRQPHISPLEKFGNARISFSTVDDKAISAATPPWR
jgi:hypothetical protein